MKLEVGMYVRTINGKIWIITSQKAISGHRKDIIKASHNIIDLSLTNLKLTPSFNLYFIYNIPPNLLIPFKVFTTFMTWKIINFTFDWFSYIIW